MPGMEPNELMRRGMFRLAVDIWAEESPADAAEWLVDVPSGIARLALPSLAAHWGSRDLATASAFADRLSGTLRTTYLYRLGRIQRPEDELLAWAAGYRSDPAFPGIVERVVAQLGDDVDGVLTLLGELSGPARARGIEAAIYRIARTNPDAALELVATSTGDKWRRLYPGLIRGIAERSPERAAAFLAERFAEAREEPRHLIATPGLAMQLFSTRRHKRMACGGRPNGFDHGVQRRTLRTDPPRHGGTRGADPSARFDRRSISGYERSSAGGRKAGRRVT